MEHFLHAFFAPKSIVLFGASERSSSIGETVYKNLSNDAFKGPIFLVNPRHSQVFGQICYKSIFEIKHKIDLAVIAAPATSVNQIIEDCGSCGVKAAIILSAGFGEMGAAGKALELKIVQSAQRFGMRFIGPNCLGIMRPSVGVNATFNKGSANSGNLALISQSGALCTAILDWSKNRKLGFSSVVSIGAATDVHFGDLLDYLIFDPRTKSILLYIEGINHARSFISALKAASRVKPVLVMKVGRHKTGTQAAKTHTGAISGQDDVFNAALRQAGAIRGYRVNDLFVAATVLSKDKRLKGDNLVIVTNGGGPGAIAADRATDLDIALPALSEKTCASLSEFLPKNWSQANPVDIIGDAPPRRYELTLLACLSDPAIHGIIVILTPQAMTEPLEVAKMIVETAKDSSKVIIACFMGGEHLISAKVFLENNDIPTFQTPEAAIEAFYYLRSFARNQKLLLQAPEPLLSETQSHSNEVKTIIENALAQGRTVLTELESMAILNAYGIETPQAAIATSSKEAVIHAESIGYPVVMKIYSNDITHKSDVGGVCLGLLNKAAVIAAYQDMIHSVSHKLPGVELMGVTIERMYTKKTGRELMVGLLTDDAFGPVISFGAGGTTVEIIRDKEVAIPPLNRTLVGELISRTKVSKMLGKFRQLPPCNMAAIEHVILSVSQMACELPWLKELDINPLIVDDQKAIALDARMVIQQPIKTGKYEHMAIHPYPSDLVKKEMLQSGELITIRPIRPEDANIEKGFVDELSFEAKYFRFMHGMQKLPQSMLVRFTQVDYDLEMALIAVVKKDGMDHEIAVARYVTNIDRVSCEFAVVVADDWQRKGIALRLMQALIVSATQKGLKQMEGTVLAENKPMLDFCRRLGFEIEKEQEDKSICNVVKHLQ